MRVGLALGGGGVMGVAHVGVLEELEAEKIEIDVISGTSAGSIIGLLYAAGGTKLVREFVEKIKQDGTLSNKNLIAQRSPDKILKEIRNKLYETVGAKSFITLPKEFYAVATDFGSGNPEAIHRGDPVEAVMTSCSYPGVFSVQKIAGRTYVDGGVTQNLPCETLKEQGCSFVIASSLNSIREFDADNLDSEQGRAKVAKRALDIMQHSLELTQIEKSDFCFSHPLEDYNWYSFSKFDEILYLGRKYAHEQIPGLVSLLRKSKSVSKNKSRKSLWRQLFPLE